MKKSKVVLIAGHHRAGMFARPHWRDPGAVIKDHKGNEVTNEHWEAEKLCLKAQEALKQEGIEVDVCPFNLDLQGKVNYVNKRYEVHDYLVSIHLNAANPHAHGFELFHYEHAIRGFIFGKKLARMVSERLGMRNRGAKRESLSQHHELKIIRGTVPTAFLFEMGFMTNSGDFDKVKKNGVEAIIDAVKYLLKEKKS